MSLNNIKNQLNSFLDFLQEQNLLLDRNDPIIVGTGKAHTQMLTWNKSVNLSKFFDEFVTIEEYLGHLKSRNFHAVLYDGGILQVTYIYKRQQIINHRLTYYPCPIKFDREELMEYPLDELVEMYCIESKNIRMLTPLRFDYDPESTKEHHPTAHLHLSMENCRVPLNSALSLGHFITFIFTNFYFHIWKNYEYIRNLPLSSHDICLSDSDKNLMHLKWVNV